MFFGKKEQELQERLYFGKPDDFLKDIFLNNQTSLMRVPQKELMTFQCPHCNEVIIIYQGKERTETKDKVVGK